MKILSDALASKRQVTIRKKNGKVYTGTVYQIHHVNRTVELWTATGPVTLDLDEISSVSLPSATGA